MTTHHDHAHDHAHTHAAAHARTAHVHDDHAHQHGHDHHHEHDHHEHDHDHAGHVHDEHCGHSHGPEPSQLAGPGGWSRGLGAILTVGIRPCSGAILVLVFALAQGMFWAGVAATFVMGLGTAITVSTIALIAVSAKGIAKRMAAGRDGSGAIFLRGIEFGAAGLVLLFGVGLLAGLYCRGARHLLLIGLVWCLAIADLSCGVLFSAIARLNHTKIISLLVSFCLRITVRACGKLVGYSETGH